MKVSLLYKHSFLPFHPQWTAVTAHGQHLEIVHDVAEVVSGREFGIATNRHLCMADMIVWLLVQTQKLKNAMYTCAQVS